MNDTIKYSFSHRIPMEKLCDGRLQPCGIFEVERTSDWPIRHLSDGFLELSVHPDPSDHQYVGFVSMDREAGEMGESAYVLNKITEYYCVDVYPEDESGFLKTVAIGEAPNLGLHLPKGYQSHQAPWMLRADPDVVLDGRHIQEPPGDRVERRLRDVRDNTVELLSEAENGVQFAFALYRAWALLSDGGYKLVLQEVGIREEVAEKIRALFVYSFQCPECEGPTSSQLDDAVRGLKTGRIGLDESIDQIFAPKPEGVSPPAFVIPGYNVGRDLTRA